MPQTVTLPDGYNGHTLVFNTDPIQQDQHCVMLGCAEPGKAHLTRWISRADLIRALFSQIKTDHLPD